MTQDAENRRRAEKEGIECISGRLITVLASSNARQELTLPYQNTLHMLELWISDTVCLLTDGNLWS